VKAGFRAGWRWPKTLGTSSSLEELDDNDADVFDAKRRGRLRIGSRELRATRGHPGNGAASQCPQQQNAALEQQLAILGIHELSGRVRQEWLNDAIASGDAGRVKAFFDSFQLESHGSGSADRGPARRGGRAPSSQGTRTWTRASIDAFYRARQKGAFKGREAEADALEKDIFAAQRDGRVAMYDYLTK
jgi:hypothetical protein